MSENVTLLCYEMSLLGSYPLHLRLVAVWVGVFYSGFLIVHTTLYS